MITARIALVLLVAACGGGASRSTQPPHGGLRNVDDANGCRPTYAEYERRWRFARGKELADFPDAFSPAEIEEIVSDEAETLLDREELYELRLIYAVFAVLIPDAPWVLAFDAAERAIAVCGEKAHRPT